VAAAPAEPPRPPVEDPPVEDPPVEDPPVEDPPVEDPLLAPVPPEPPPLCPPSSASLSAHPRIARAPNAAKSAQCLDSER
jgi:hypothetical protein